VDSVFNPVFSLTETLRYATLSGLQQTWGKEKWEAMLKHLQARLHDCGACETKLKALVGDFERTMERHVLNLMNDRQESGNIDAMKDRLKRVCIFHPKTRQVPLDEQVTLKDLKSVFPEAFPGFGR